MADTNYLFVHFRETLPDALGEQCYFGLSRDGYHWAETNGGQPILTSQVGEKGVRDFTIVRTQDNKLHIIATDLSLANNFKTKYHNSWAEINRHGSKYFVVWDSDDLVHWSDSRMIELGNEHFGCLWAPDVIWDAEHQDYVLHWSSSVDYNDWGNQVIYFARTTDFVHFTQPEILYAKDDASIIDSAMYEKDGKYYLFVKSANNPTTIIELWSGSATGPWTRVPGFDQAMSPLEKGQYEAPTAFEQPDGTWCLFLDYYGPQHAQVYVPFVARDIATGEFKMATGEFSFPYGFKHGTILKITPAEYDRIKQAFA